MPNDPFRVAMYAESAPAAVSMPATHAHNRSARRRQFSSHTGLSSLLLIKLYSSTGRIIPLKTLAGLHNRLGAEGASGQGIRGLNRPSETIVIRFRSITARDPPATPAALTAFLPARPDERAPAGTRLYALPKARLQLRHRKRRRAGRRRAANFCASRGTIRGARNADGCILARSKNG